MLRRALSQAAAHWRHDSARLRCARFEIRAASATPLETPAGHADRTNRQRRRAHTLHLALMARARQYPSATAALVTIVDQFSK